MIVDCGLGIIVGVQVRVVDVNILELDGLGIIVRCNLLSRWWLEGVLRGMCRGFDG